MNSEINQHTNTTTKKKTAGLHDLPQECAIGPDESMPLWVARLVGQDEPNGDDVLNNRLNEDYRRRALVCALLMCESYVIAMDPGPDEPDPGPLTDKEKVNLIALQMFLTAAACFQTAFEGSPKSYESVDDYEVAVIERYSDSSSITRETVDREYNALFSTFPVIMSGLEKCWQQCVEEAGIDKYTHHRLYEMLYGTWKICLTGMIAEIRAGISGGETCQ